MASDGLAGLPKVVSQQQRRNQLVCLNLLFEKGLKQIAGIISRIGISFAGFLSF
jgi:hypothetical protein